MSLLNEFIVRVRVAYHLCERMEKLLLHQSINYAIPLCESTVWTSHRVNPLNDTECVHYANPHCEPTVSIRSLNPLYDILYETR